jgi:hypothetical protein
LGDLKFLALQMSRKECPYLADRTDGGIATPVA